MLPNPYQSPVDAAVLPFDQGDLQLPNVGRLALLLRVLVVGEIVVGILSVVVYSFTQATLPEPLREYLELESEAAITMQDLFVAGFAVLLLILIVVGSIGLFVFWRPARLVYLVATIIGVLITPLFGPTVQTGWDAPLEETASLIAGAIVALVYFSPLRAVFEKRRMGV